MKLTGEMGSCGKALFGVGVPQRHQAIRSGEGQGTEHDGVHCREYRRGRAGTEPEDEHHDEGKGWMLSELPQRDAERAGDVEACRLRSTVGACRVPLQHREP